MISHRRLAPLIRRAQEHQDKTAMDLAKRQAMLDNHASRLEELQRYATEYSQAPIQETTVRPSQLVNRQAFLERIDTAVQQQTLNVNHTRQSVELERSRLLLASRDKKVLEQLAASYKSLEQQAEEKRLQREQDDLGAQRVRKLQQTNLQEAVEKE